MASDIEICNLALDQIGQPSISSFTDGSRAGSVCGRQFPALLESWLTDHTWNFAKSRVSLAADATSPPSGFVYQYTPPGDCLRVLSTGTPYDFQVELGSDGLIKKVLTDAPPPIVIEYIRYVNNPTGWLGRFREAFIVALAAKLANALASDYKGGATLQQVGDRLFWEAKAVDGSEGSPIRIESTALTTDVRIG